MLSEKKIENTPVMILMVGIEKRDNLMRIHHQFLKRSEKKKN
jgi:hypothetical protein